MRILFTGVLLLYLVFFVGMVRDSLRWFVLRRRGETELPFGIHLVQSPYFGLTMGMMMISFGMTGWEGLGVNAGVWPQALPWWVGLLIGAFFSGQGIQAALRQRRGDRRLAEAFDERMRAIQFRTDQATLWLLWVYLLVRGLVDFGAGRTSEEISAAYFQLLAANPWFQTMGLVLLLSFGSQAYFSRRMS